jgi:hypothetical protein
MSTDEIKKVLSSRFPSEKFSRTSKVKDSFGYTHRSFVSKQRNVVVTSFDEDDCDITDIVEVQVVPKSSDLKDGQRLWMVGGPLSNYYYYIKYHDDCHYLIITDKYTFDTYGHLDDSHGKDNFIESLISLHAKNGSVSNAMESVYEIEDCEVSTIENLLPKLGATNNPAFNW